MNLKKQVSELKSLVEGSAKSESHAEIWRQALSVMDEMASRIERIGLNQAKILDYVEALDEDLSVMESQMSNPGNPDEDDEEYDLGSGEDLSSDLKTDHS